MEGTLNERSWYYNNIANFITSVRLICSVCIVFIGVWYPEMITAIFIFIVTAAISDLLDGKMARSKNIASEFGGFLDRLADKLYICPVIIIIVWRYWPMDDIHPLSKIITEGIGGAVILLEAILIFSGIVGGIHGLSISSNQWGKLKMVLETCAVIFWFLSLMLAQYVNIDLRVSIVVIDIYLALAVFYAVKSLGGYYVRFNQGMRKK